MDEHDLRELEELAEKATPGPRRRVMNSKTTPPDTKPRELPPVQNNWLRAHLGHMIQARLLDGKTLVGELSGFDTFTLALRAKNGKELLVYKQALAYLVPHTTEDRESP